MIEVTSNMTEQVSPRPGGIWKKWGVDGRTRISGDFTVAEVNVFKERRHDSVFASQFAHLHEHGHVAVAQDLIDQADVSEAQKMLGSYDKWQIEVEAWIRTIPTDIELEEGKFILDCLNSYRRSLKTSGKEWDAAVELFAERTTCHDQCAQELREYQPLEPEAGESPPECCEFVPADEDDEESPEPQAGTYDHRWNRDVILKKLRKGMTLEQVGHQHGLDPTKATPVAIITSQQGAQ